MSGRFDAMLSLRRGAGPGFANPKFNASVQDLALVAGRLLAAGYFTSAAGQTRDGLARLDPARAS